jgi:hypothetical protein
MHPGATLFLDCCVQEELWPDGSWPLVSASQAANVERLFALAREAAIRQGGLVCRHTPNGTPTHPGAPVHCGEDVTWSVRPPGCEPVLPIVIARCEAPADGLRLDRTSALYLDSGCGAPPDAAPAHARAFAHLTAGVRDTVVFGAGIEHALARVIEPLLARRIRTHVALDASGAADEVAAQLVVADWKRRGVDVTTVAMVERMLLRN